MAFNCKIFHFIPCCFYLVLGQLPNRLFSSESLGLANDKPASRNCFLTPQQGHLVPKSYHISCLIYL